MKAHAFRSGGALIERFQAVLAEEVEKREGLAGTWADDRRELKLAGRRWMN